jgi:Flp pilus assembly protein TadG
MNRIIATLTRHLQESRRGQALVETAIALPIILLLSLAAFDLGRGIVAHIALHEATQEGSLYAAYEYGGFPSKPVADSAVANLVNDSSPTSESVADAEVTVPTCTTSPAPGTITVRSTYELPVISPPAQAIFGPTLALSVEISATNFNGACPP